MGEGRYAWLLHGGISRRIALTMIASLLAIQAQAFLQIRLFSDPVLHLTGMRTLEDAVVHDYEQLFAVPPAQRSGLLETLERQLPLRLQLTRDRPNAIPVDLAPTSLRLAQSLRHRLGLAPDRLMVSRMKVLGPFPVPDLQVQVATLDTTSRAGSSASADNAADTLAPPNLRIAVEGPDGTWLSAIPLAFDDHSSVLHSPYVPLLVGGAIIAFFSVGTARSIVKPLDRLVLAAARVGRSREFVPVSADGLHEFAAVARAFEDIQKRLLRFIDDRTQMLGAISHDLRSCLTRLRVTAETGSSNETQRVLLREIDEMTVMLESTLAFARGEAHRSPSQAIDIAALLISVVDDAIDDGFDAQYAGPDHIEIWGVPVSLKRAFRNLIDNAVKYGGLARVSLDADEDMVRVVIADDGSGIAPESIDEALKPFRRLDDARSGTIPGAGLGLTIARDAILSHGGTLSFRNVAPRGLRVEVSLPTLTGDSAGHQRPV